MNPPRPCLLLPLLPLLLAAGLQAESGQDPVAPFPSVEGSVYATAINTVSNIAYLGGDISYLGYRAPNLALLDPTTGVPKPGFPFTNGVVHQVISDGAGGYWVMGVFSQIGVRNQSVAVSNLARVVKNGSAWEVTAVPQTVNNAIYCAFLNGSTLYVGGEFTDITGYTRLRAAAINVATGTAFGQLLPWNPGVADGSVHALSVAGGHVWLGGSFTQVGPAARKGLASVDLVNGSPDQWNQEPAGEVHAFAVNGTTLFAGGQFNESGYRRLNLSRFGTTANIPDEGFPQADGAVNACLVDGSGGWYLAGDFTHIAGIERTRFAHIRADGSVDPAFTPTADGPVQALVLSGSRLYAGGDFTHVSGSNRTRLVALNATTGLVEAGWSADADAEVRVLQVVGGRLWAGGDFTWVGTRPRHHLASLDLTTGAVSDWTLGFTAWPRALAGQGQNLLVGSQDRAPENYWWQITNQVGHYIPSLAGVTVADGTLQPRFPAANGQILCLISDGTGGWYAGGDFTAIAGVARQRLAHIQADFTIDPLWQPEASSTVRCLALSGNLLYAGGDFTAIGGANRNRLAALGVGSHPTAYGQAVGWNPNANSTVGAVAIAGDGIYAGGGFTQIGGANRGGLAKLTLDTAVATAFNPRPNGPINALTVASGRLFAAGSFTDLAGTAEDDPDYLVSFEVTGGSRDDWAPAPNGPVYALSVVGSQLWFGGSFSYVGSTPRSCAASVGIATGPVSLAGWNPAPNQQVNALVCDGTTAYLGGSFINLGANSRPYLARVDATSGVLSAWPVTPDQAVTAVAVSGSTLAFGGAFAWSQVQGVGPLTALALDGPATGSLRAGWSVSPAGGHAYVRALAVAGDGTIYIGGSFLTLNGQSRQGLGAVTSAGVLTSFSPQLDGPVSCLTLDGTTLYLGAIPSDPGMGRFTSVAGSSRRGAAAINLTTGLATAFDPGIDRPSESHVDDVSSLAVAGGKALVGGSYDHCAQANRTQVLALDSSTGRVTPWSATINSVWWPGVRSLIIDGTRLLVGGDFSQVNGVDRNRIAALALTDAALQPWNPNATGNTYWVPFLSLYGRTCHVAAWGYYLDPEHSLTGLGGQARRNLGALDADTAVPTAWDPQARQGNLFTILAGPDGVVVGGAGEWYGGGERAGLAAIDLAQSAPLPWAPQVEGQWWSDPLGVWRQGVATLAVSGTGLNETVFVGGSFSSINNQTRDNLAALQGVGGSSAGTLTDYRADVNGPVNVLRLSGQTLYLGGEFTSACGVGRNHAALVEATTAVTTAVANLGATSLSVRASGAKTVNAGSAVSIGNRSYLLAATVTFTASALTKTITLASGLVSAIPAGASVGLPATALTWNPDVDGPVRALVLDGSRVYLGGSFSQVAGASRSNLAAVGTNGTLAAWNSGADNTVTSLLVDSGTVYIGGIFSQVGGQNRTRLAAVLADGTVTTWAPSSNGAVTGLAKGDHDLVVAGSFSQINGRTAYGLASIDPVTATAFGDWPQLNNGRGFELLRWNSNVLVLGTFITLDQRLPHSGVALVPLRPAGLAGDANGDGVVNSLDLNLVLSHFGFTVDSSGWDARADLNSDGVVNVDDLQLVVSHFGG